MAMVFLKVSGFFQQNNALCHTQKLFRNGFMNIAKSSRCWVGLQFPQISMFRMHWQTSPIHRGPTSQFTGRKGSAANVWVPDSTPQMTHLQRWSPCLSGSVLIWQHNWELWSISISIRLNSLCMKHDLIINQQNNNSSCYKWQFALTDTFGWFKRLVYSRTGCY